MWSTKSRFPKYTVIWNKQNKLINKKDSVNKQSNKLFGQNFYAYGQNGSGWTVEELDSIWLSQVATDVTESIGLCKQTLKLNYGNLKYIL